MLDLWSPLERGRLRFRRTLQRRSKSSPSESLFFHHIAKTGGTSLIRAIRAATAPNLAVSEGGDLSAAYTRALVTAGLRPGQFIYGHPGPGAASPLRGKARMITLLREPRDQVISNYLWVRGDPALPAHKAAREMELREFLLAWPYFAIFQTASLHVAIDEQPLTHAEDVVKRLPSIFDYLRQFYLVGTVKTAPRMLERLAPFMGWDGAPRFPHRRKTKLAAQQRAWMQEQFEDLQSHPQLAPLFAAERAVFNAACEVEADLFGCDGSRVRGSDEGRTPPAAERSTRRV